MPRYTYACESCGTEITERRSMAERDDLPTCQHGEAFHPASHPMKRTLGQTSFVLKGEGWFRDGYGQKAPGA
jgi:putative FmdB family regulatory protein